jgi:hypothetical protein
VHDSSGEPVIAPLAGHHRITAKTAPVSLGTPPAEGVQRNPAEAGRPAVVAAWPARWPAGTGPLPHHRRKPAAAGAPR